MVFKVILRRSRHLLISLLSSIHFARGVCVKGQDCEYLHRLPTIHDMLV